MKNYIIKLTILVNIFFITISYSQEDNKKITDLSKIINETYDKHQDKDKKVEVEKSVFLARQIIRIGKDAEEKINELKNLAYREEEDVCPIIKAAIDENSKMKKKSQLDVEVIALNVALGAPEEWELIERCTQEEYGKPINLAEVYQRYDETGLSFLNGETTTGSGKSSAGGAPSSFYFASPGISTNSGNNTNCDDSDKKVVTESSVEMEITNPGSP